MRDVCDFKEALPKACNVVNGVTLRRGGGLLYGAGPSPGCGMIRLIIQRVFRGVRTGKQTPADEVSQVKIPNQQQTPIIQRYTPLSAECLVL